MIQPFSIDVPNAVLDDLNTRLAATRFLPISASTGNAGMTPAYLRDLISYWRARFDWRRQQALLNGFRHQLATVDGTKIYFIHERGRGPAPLPLILTHGFPDSFYRFYKLIPLLCDPALHGGDAIDSFDVVVPSLPGYAFSEPRTSHGGLFGFADILHVLMTKTLGYAKFGAHGGDWGSTITEHLARSHPHSVVGIHLTDIPFWHTFQKPDDLSAAERDFLAKIEKWQKDEGAYAFIQGTQPDTLAAALNDSPAGLAAWIVEKFQRWSDCGGDVETRFTKDELLTNVMLYWVTGTIRSSFQPYADVMSAGAMRWIKEAVKGWLGSSQTPAAFALFPKDLAQPPPREWAERFFNVQRWTTFSSGGHFAALEEPENLAEDIRAFFRPLRAQI